MPNTCNHREQLYLEGSFFRQPNACEEEVTKPGGQSQLVKYYYLCVCVSVHI